MTSTTWTTHANMPGAEPLTGSVERVTFHNEDNGFCVLRVKARGHKDLVTVTGNAASISPGEYVECIGEWINDRNYGLQFRARKLATVRPSTIEGIEKYLGSGMIRGIGPHFARKLVKAFGEAVFDIIENEPERMLELPGIGVKRKERVVCAWAEQKVVREIMVFLQSYGVGTSRAVRIYRTYGREAIARVSENPYRLALDIHGIGFKTADTIARNLGIPGDSLIRAQAGVRHVLQEMAGEGHCAMDRAALIEGAVKLLGIQAGLADTAIDTEVEEGNLVEERTGDRILIYTASLRQAEISVAEALLQLAAGRPVYAEIDAEIAIPAVEAKRGIELSASQRRAVALALTSKVLAITGGPGVGKTTLLASILEILADSMPAGGEAPRILLCAPTGRAAKRLSESTGREASTIHRALEFDARRFGFKRGRDNPLPADIVVIDEASMIDIVLMNNLLKAIPEQATLLIVGDVDQLPSVGPGAVLSDIIESGAIAVVRLTEIFRQAASSRIIVNSHRINQGLMPLKDESARAGGSLSDFYFVPAETPELIIERLLEIVSNRIPKRFGLDPIKDIQVLTPMNRGSLGSRSLNIELKNRLNPVKDGPQVSKFGSTYSSGDKVIQTVNDYDKEVFNGDIGTISSIDLEQSQILVDFEGRPVVYDLHELDELSLAFAASIHKSQGSEYGAVVIPLATQHYVMLERNLLYTGVTRGKRLVVIIGQPKALAMAVKNKQSARRVTGLSFRLGPAPGLASQR